MEEIVFFYPEKHEGHSETGHMERPERVEAIRIALEDAGIWEQYPHLSPKEVPESVLQRIHEPSFLEKIRLASERSQRPDMDTYITPHSWHLALNAAGGGLAASEAVWRGGAKRGFALCRPPGHHATKNQAMGFCLLNNIAIAAENLLQTQSAKKIVIIDIDLHHGNGTQDIFYDRSDVVFFSIHQVPLYPGTGYSNETGVGEGEGMTVNIPLPPHSGDQARLAAADEIILPLLDRFQPEIILMSVGFDAHWKDPLGQQRASCDNYGAIVSKFASWADQHCEGRIALFLEGGYDLFAGALGALAVTQALLGNPWDDPFGPSPNEETDRWRSVIDQIKQKFDL